MTDSNNKGCNIFRLGKHIGSAAERLVFVKRLTLIFASISGGITVSVIGEAASCVFLISDMMEQEESGLTGAMAVDLMPYLAPSRARVFENPIRPDFAAL